MTGFVNRNSFAFRLRIITTDLNRRRTVHTRQSLNPQRREMRRLHIWICVRNIAGEQRNKGECLNNRKNGNTKRYIMVIPDRKKQTTTISNRINFP